jgi:hypothetical protein
MTQFAIYLDIFIFATDQELEACEVMEHIMCYNHSLGRKDTLKFIYYFMIMFLKI